MRKNKGIFKNVRKDHGKRGMWVESGNQVYCTVTAEDKMECDI